MRAVTMTAIGLAALGAAVPAISPAIAALAPNYQRMAELQRILEHPGVAGAFGGTPIDRIEFVRPDLYRVTAGRCTLSVAIVGLPMPANMVGARRFDVRPGRSSCGR